MSNKNLTKKEKFDNLIKKNLISSGISKDAFCGSLEDSESKYPFYFNEAAFDVFVQEMKTLYPKHYKKYDGDAAASENKGGAGGELKPGRNGLTPPKMASVASSSRFCYLALRNGTDALIKDRFVSGNEIEFEKECKIFNRGTAPQLDAFIKDDNCNIYIEAKCHEIFDTHKVEFSKTYWKYFKKDEVLSKALEGIQEGDKVFELPLSLFRLEETSSCFDIKQLICHLLGIKEQNKGMKAKLVYLFFEPIADNDEDYVFINKVFDELTTEIKLIFESDIIKNFCDANNIELRAIREKSRIMEPLSIYNKITIY